MALLTCDNLSFGYAETAILQDVALQLSAGQCVGLIGANGAGKSTLLQLLMGLKKPQQGSVCLKGQDIQSLTRPQIGKILSYVPQQSPEDVGLRVVDVVAMGRYVHQPRWFGVNTDDQQIIEQALAETDLTALAERSLQSLSGGERQRVFIARALAQQAAMLLLDEPTASLDLNHQLEVMQLLNRFVKQGGGVLIALHDLSLAARFCQQLVLLHQGEVVANGSPDAVLTPENLAHYFRVEADIIKQPDSGALFINPVTPLPPN